MQALMCSTIRNGKYSDLMQRLFFESHLSSRVKTALSTSAMEADHTVTRIKGPRTDTADRPLYHCKRDAV